MRFAAYWMRVCWVLGEMALRGDMGRNLSGYFTWKNEQWYVFCQEKNWIVVVVRLIDGWRRDLPSACTRTTYIVEVVDLVVRRTDEVGLQPRPLLTLAPSQPRPATSPRHQPRARIALDPSQASAISYTKGNLVSPQHQPSVSSRKSASKTHKRWFVFEA